MTDILPAYHSIIIQYTLHCTETLCRGFVFFVSINNRNHFEKDDTIIALGEPDDIFSHYSGEIIRLSDTQILAPGYVDA